MYTLEDRGIISEIACGNNFGYVLEKESYFVSTDYKVLLGQHNDIFVPCMKMLYNGKIELYYITDGFVSMLAMMEGLMPDQLANIVINLFGSVMEVKNNGFLQSQNIDISWNKIFIDPATLMVRLVYLPINARAFGSHVEFESELRSSLVKFMHKMVAASSNKLDKFVQDLANGILSIEDIYKKYKGVTAEPSSPKKEEMVLENDNRGGGVRVLKLAAINTSEYFEAALEQPQTVIGRKQESVDIAFPFNRAIGRRHCVVTNHNGNYCIIDENSLNGTYVNGVKIAPGESVPIKRGDVIRIADREFQLK